jgi:hypothetical protein
MPSLIFLPVCVLLFLAVLIFAEFIRNYESPGKALMHNEVLIPFGSLDLQTSLPGVTADVAELPSNLENL